MLTNEQLDELLRDAEEEALHDWTVVSLHVRIADARELVAAARRGAEAVRLLHMLDRPDARHPDVAAFLDGLDDGNE